MELYDLFGVMHSLSNLCMFALICQTKVVPQYGRTKADEANVAAKNKKGGNIQVSRWL